MARAREIAFHQEPRAASRDGAQSEGRWPFASSALLVLTSSALLWALIIAAAHWLIA